MLIRPAFLRRTPEGGPGGKISTGGAFQGVQGATVLHCLARLHEMVIQGATKGATKCYEGCYIFEIFKESGLNLSLSIPLKTARNP